MSRWTGWAVLVIAAILVYSLMFTTFESWTGTWRSAESGGLVRVNVECPMPFAVLVSGAEPDHAENKGLCDPTARTLPLEAGLVVLAAILLAWAAVTRPRPKRLEPMSSQLNLGQDASPDWARGETPVDNGPAERSP